MARQAVLTVLVYAYTICVMVGLGASIDVDIFEEVRKAPRAVLCGLCSQFGIMPLLAFSLSVAFGLGDAESIAILLVGMSPGGVTSTLFVYLCRANVTVSLVMTTLSTFAALFMMPLLLFVYARPPLASSNGSRVSYVAIVATLLVATAPAVLGWRVRRRFDGVGQVLETWATKVGFFLIVATLVAVFSWPSGNSGGVTLKAVVVMFLLSPCGFALGYTAARAAGLDLTLARTVSIETGIQQVGIAAAIAVNSFKGDTLHKMVSILAIFGLITFLDGIAWATLLRYLAVGGEGASSAAGEGEEKKNNDKVPLEKAPAHDDCDNIEDPPPVSGEPSDDDIAPSSSAKKLQSQEEKAAFELTDHRPLAAAT